MAVTTVFSVQVLSPGQVMPDRRLSVRKSRVQELLRKAFATCGLSPSFSWSAEDGLALHVLLLDDGQRLLTFFGLGSSDPLVIVDAEIRRISAQLQAFAGRGLVFFADVEALESSVPGGAKYIQEFAPNRHQDRSAIPIQHADGEPGIQVFYPLPRKFLRAAPERILFALKSVSLKCAEIRIRQVGGLKTKTDARLYWPGAERWSRLIADKLYEGMHQNSTFEARVFGAANPSGTVTRYDLGHPDDLTRPGARDSLPHAA